MYLNYRELDADVIIIGSGLSGLGAAYYMLQKNPHHDLLVLDVDGAQHVSPESSNWWLSNTYKIKGKFSLLKDFKFDNIKCDILFACSEQKNLISLLESFQMPLMNNSADYYGQILVDHEKIYKYSRREEIFNFFPSMDMTLFHIVCTQINDLSKNVTFEKSKKNSEMLIYDAMSMEALLNNLTNAEIVRDVISQTFYINCGLPPKDVSALFFLCYCNSMGKIENLFQNNAAGLYRFYLKGGAHSLKSRLCEVLDKNYIKKVSKINGINSDENSVEIITPEECFVTKKVVVTLNAAEIPQIKFEPPLTTEEHVMFDESVKGTLKKFKVAYKMPFWREKGLSGEVYVLNTKNRNGPIQICLSASEIEAYILIGLADRSGKKHNILKQLAIYFGDEAMNPVNYTEDDSSFFDLGFPSGCKNMKFFQSIRVNSERIILACPETTSNWYGTAAGSFEAGFIGAIRALRDLNPSTLNFDDYNFISQNEYFIPPRRLGVFGVKWHMLVPITLLAVLLIRKIKKYFFSRFV